MSRVMTDEEIAAEQELMRQQASGESVSHLSGVEISDEAARAVTPFDLLDGRNYTDKATRDARFEVCRGCDRLFKPTKTCRECGCFMALKTWLSDAECPRNLWGGA